MADIELVIKMPEEMYNWVNDVNKFSNNYGTSDFIDLVKNGTPLPKGHGRLIDTDDLDITTITTDDYSGNEVLDVVLKEDVDNASTLIEADKE